MALTPILGIQQVATNQSNKEATINDAILALEGAGNGTLALDFTNLLTGTYALTIADFSRNFLFKATNVPAGNPNAGLSVPRLLNGHTIQRVFVVKNATIAELSVTIQGAAVGTTGAEGISIPQNSARLLAMDGDDLIIASESSTVSRFIDIADAPHTYSGKSGLTFRVNSTEDGLEFAEAFSIHDLSDVDDSANTDGAVLRYNATDTKWVASALNLVTTFLGLTDTPSSFAGKASFIVHVNAAENALEFADPAALGGPVTGGGSTGQVLTKNSAAEGDYSWDTPQMLPDGGTAGQWLRKVSPTDGDAGWSDFPQEVPDGGTIGQVLAKTTSADGAVGWEDVRDLAKAYTPAVVNAVAVSLISGDSIHLPWTPKVGNALVVAYFSNGAIVPATGWTTLTSLGASGTVWIAAATLAKLVQVGDTAIIAPTPANAADAAIVYEVDARYIRAGITSLVAHMGYNDTALPTLAETIPSIVMIGSVNRVGNHPTYTVTGTSFTAVTNQDSAAGGNRYAGGLYVDPTADTATINVGYSLNGGDTGGYFYIAVPAIEEGLEEAPSDNKLYMRRNKAWAAAPAVALVLNVGDETTALTAGTGKLTMRLPYNFALQKVKGSLARVSTGVAVGINVKANGSSVFSTALTIDPNQKTSVGAATPSVLTGSGIYADDTEITIDITAAGTNAAGLKIYLIGTPI